MIITKTIRTRAEETIFTLNKKEILKTDKYTYLGCTINDSGNLLDTQKELYTKALKALFKIHQSLGTYNSSPIIYNKLFDTLIKPILLYNSEIWGIELLNKLKNHDPSTQFDILDSEPFEKLHTKFCKLNLRVGKFTSNVASKKELGRDQLILQINTNILKYWLRLEQSTNNSILNDAYLCCQTLNKNNKLSWLSYPKMILAKHIDTTNTVQTETDIETFIEKFKTAYSTYQHNKIESSTKLEVYKNIHDTSPANYLQSIKNCNYRQALTKLRICAHRLEIETGRYRDIPRQLRTCKLCNIQEIEDEQHFLCNCTAFSSIRYNFYQKYLTNIPKFLDLDDKQKLYSIINCNVELAPIVGRFCHEMLVKRQKLIS